MITHQLHFMRQLPQMVKHSLKELLPFSLVYAYLQILRHLVMSDSSFVGQTIGGALFTQHWFLWTSQQLFQLSRMTLFFMASIFVAQLVNQMLTFWGKANQRAVFLAFLLTWILFFQSDHLMTHHLSQPFWLLLIVFAVGMGLAFVAFHQINVQRRAFLVLIFLFLAYLMAETVSKHSNYSLDFWLQTLSMDWLGNGPTHFSGVLFWSVLTGLLPIFGFSLPLSLQQPTTNLQVSADNLTMALSGHASGIHLQTLYTVRDSFAMIGGVGNTLALVGLLYLLAHRYQLHHFKKIALLCLIPTLFDQVLPLYLAVPLLFDLQLILPMLGTIVVSEGIGALMLHWHWLDPAVYTIPSGTPNIFFGFLASNGDWRYGLVTLLILVLSAGIYWPYLNRLIAKEGGGHG